jgi:hypothetical protein
MKYAIFFSKLTFKRILILENCVFSRFVLYRVIKMSLCTVSVKNSVYSNNPHTIHDLNMAITACVRNVYRAILNTVFENTVRRVNKCLETGSGHFEHYL